jgi:hypothetical protein
VETHRPFLSAKPPTKFRKKRYPNRREIPDVTDVTELRQILNIMNKLMATEGAGITRRPVEFVSFIKALCGQGQIGPDRYCRESQGGLRVCLLRCRKLIAV